MHKPRELDMLHGPLLGNLIRFALPIALSSMLQQLFNAVDTSVVGRFVGDTAFSAIGATNALSMMFMSMCMGAAIPFIGIWGIWLTTGLTWAVTALFALVRYKHGAWKSKKLV